MNFGVVWNVVKKVLRIVTLAQDDKQLRIDELDQIEAIVEVGESVVRDIRHD